VVVKGPVERREAHVYRALRPMLKRADVALPRVEWANARWLVLEDLPRRLPIEDALGNPGVLRMLRRLHACLLDLDDAFVSAWPDDLTSRALSIFELEVQRSLAPRLARIRLAALPLFEPASIISGDPNPTNWGMREDGSLVLYDWGRIGRGAPAIDLAITVPGLGDAAAYALVASVYGPPARVPDIAAAKAWTVVHYLAEALAGRVSTSESVIDRLRSIVPPWIEAVGEVVV
jgi:hypothetical protein